jgi:uncharacterized protein (DUF849 family)
MEMVDKESPLILEVALNGITSPARNPAAPATPTEIATDGLRCMEAGAAIVHTHLDDFFLPTAEAAARYLEAYEAILQQRPDAILYPTIALGDTIAERYGHHDILAEAGAIRAGLLDPGSVNLGMMNPDGMPADVDVVYVTSPSDIAYEMEACHRLRLGPNIAIFEAGYLRVILASLAAGTLPAGAFVKFYFSEGGYLGAGEPMFSPPPIVEALDMYLAMLSRHGGATPAWAVAVLGGSLLDSEIADRAVAAGGHLRVGLEDFQDAESNLAEVERARALAERHGRRLATTAETAAILGLPRGV